MPVEYSLVRIDDRLMHGQVAVGWTKAVHPDHIIVANTAAFNDPMQKMLIEMASPPRFGLTICQIEQVANVCMQPQMENKRVIILFASVTDALIAVEHGLKVDHINVGGMRFSNGKKQILKAVAIDQADIDQFKQLIEKGIKVDVQMVPTDDPIPITRYF